MPIHCSLFQKENFRHCEVGQALQKGQNQHKGHMMCAEGGLLSWLVAICCSCSLLPDTPSLASKPSINFFHGSQISSGRERERPGLDSRKFHSQVDSLTCSEPAPVTTRTLVLLFASSSLHHHFTLLVFKLLKKSILPRPAVPEQRASGCLRAGGAGSVHGT